MTSALHPQFRFETLVVGAANRLAATAARAVAEAPGSVYNPLFVYARPGLGKTHLLMAIAHAAVAIDPRLVVQYLTLDAFLESFNTAVASGQGEAYRRRFADVGLLLLDDVQFLSQRREMQAELIRLIDTVQSAGRQIVLTSDRPPAEIEGLDERLIRRFAGGLVIDILAPDYETRVAILRRRAEERGVAFGPGVLEAVAAADIDNVRELIGALNRLIAYQAASDTPLDAIQARFVVGGADARDLELAVPDQPAAPAAEETPAPAERDEFADFLFEVSATVSQQVESWRSRVAEAILRWEGEGYRTARLEQLLADDLVADPASALRAFETDVERLQALAVEVASQAPELAGSPLLRDPGDMAAAEALADQARRGANPPPAPSPHWKLEQFLESTSNRMAVRAAAAVVADAGGKYNPFVIVGATGTGKTHLLHGLGNALAERGGVVACLGAHEFVDELIAAIDRDATAAWRARYRAVDAFLLDDVHLVAGKDRTQDELFLLFNVLLDSGRQMAFTSAVPLAEMQGIEPRLLTRLEGGLVVDLPAPDRDLRQRAIERLLAARLDGVDPELAAYIASRPADSMRSALGLVQRVLNAAEVQQVHPTAALARETLEGVTPRPPRRSIPVRVTGALAPTSGGIRSREKMVWEWPDAASRMIEEWR
ncbi:MAG: DnaA ATPase domain-containing protein [Bacillota bacterium]|jgi:chromosomal replication initiation ATPase DnaA